MTTYPSPSGGPYMNTNAPGGYPPVPGNQYVPTNPPPGDGFPGGFQQPYPNTGGGPMPSGNQEQGPTAPSLDNMEKVPGYENVTFNTGILTPPVAPDWKGQAPERQDLSKIPAFSEEQVREAVVQHASEHCCYGSGVAREMVINDIRMSSAFHYSLETFCEKRESAWNFEPYNGQAIDGPMNGPAPMPWEVMVLPQQYFQNAKSKMEVPHTASVKPCHSCVGNGRVRCDRCFGRGQEQCTWCNGQGRKKHFDDWEPCTSCNSTGHQRCFSCSGTGQQKCKTCSGKGNLKCFVQLTVTWVNHVEDYISETSTMPKELIREVSGQVVFKEQHPRVWPISHAPDRLVNEASNNLVLKHNTAFPIERILQQRHQLRIVPIANSEYQWKNKNGDFFVYGFEHKVYFPDYPQSCCCGCVIL